MHHSRMQRIRNGERMNIVVNYSETMTLVHVERIGDNVSIEGIDGSALIPLVDIPSDNELIKQVHLLLDGVLV